MFAVLQLSLDQAIPLETLKQAVMATRSLSKPDCTLLERELFGIVAGNLEQDEAVGMQAALRERGIETEVVDEADLPTLAPPRRAQAFRLLPTGLQVIEYTGQEPVFDQAAFVFAMAGHVRHLKNLPFQKLEWVVTPGPRGSVSRKVEAVTDHRLEDVPEFRLEFYFACEPYRLQWILDDHSVLRANDEVIKFRDRERIDALLAMLANTLPAERVGQGIRRAHSGEELIYPSVRAFEEEIVWSFYRLMRGSRL